ncbi:4Fe-4S dicluster domain-containing protein [candidate division KSB1 bacterium]|nr:4Fe-4S dicluster domain-containing protein [candidate division KSB1 bacterium]
MDISDYTVFMIGALILLLSVYAFLISRREKEQVAAKRFLMTGVIVAFVYFSCLIWSFPGKDFFSALLIAIPVVAAIAVLFPFHRVVRMPMPGGPGEQQRIDERDIMFSRRELVPGTARFKAYYKRKPDHKSLDDLFRSKPGLLSPQAVYADPLMFAACRPSFEGVKQLHPLAEGTPDAKAVSAEAGEFTRFIKFWGKKLGAHRLGITRLRDYHLYSIRGRGERYGEKIELDHQYAIALVVEMDYDMMRQAPQPQAMMESSNQYLKSGAIAIQIAQFIRSIGYAATAHIDARYQVVCSLVARDAGLGEIGRMGLLMTPDLGPRVRIAVVTTNLPLVTDSVKQERSMIDFCRHCNKCARLCPSNAIPFDDMKEIDGVLRWQINSEACYTFWCSIGTDCGRCVAVCPFAHADNPLHAAIRYAIRRSFLFRRLGIYLDDFYYGKSPAPRRDENVKNRSEKGRI